MNLNYLKKKKSKNELSKVDIVLFTQLQEELKESIEESLNFKVE